MKIMFNPPNHIQTKTLEEHRQYLYRIVRLKLFFLHSWLRNHPEEEFRHVIRNRVDIYRKTDVNPFGYNPAELYWDSKAWLDMENKTEKLFHTCRNSSTVFENAAFEVFHASIDARCERDFRDRTQLNGYQCGSLRHTIGAREDGSVGFHVANAVAPYSFFDDPEYLPRCFLTMLDFIEREYDATRISITPTWLNSYPKWLALFPDEWRDNRTPEMRDNVLWHYGFWGQFITGRGTFNAKYGELLRKTGELPYYPCSSNCSISAMRASLERFLYRACP